MNVLCIKGKRKEKVSQCELPAVEKKSVPFLRRREKTFPASFGLEVEKKMFSNQTIGKKKKNDKNVQHETVGVRGREEGREGGRVKRKARRENNENRSENNNKRGWI